MATAKKTEKIAGNGSKRLRTATSNVDRNKLYPINEAIKLVKNSATAKFDESIEIAVNLGVDMRQSDQAVRGVIAMPNGIGKTLRVAVFAQDAKAEEAKKAGADVIGADDLVEAIQGGTIDFERCIATPDMMATVGKVAKVRGPRGLMPNPKLGTVTNDIADAVIVHAGLGKASFTEKQLAENIQTFIKALKDAKPASTKGIYLKRLAISSTMGPGIRVDLSSLEAA